MASPDKTTPRSEGEQKPAAPSISLPKGGGAIRGIGEKFAANPVTGTGSMSVPLATSPGRSGFGPQLSLSYDSGAGNGPFGFGWTLSLPAISRKTDKGLPQYRDAEDSDVYILSGAEDLVPVLQPDGERFADDTTAPGFTIHRYRPRIEGLFARIERWTNQTTGEIRWRSITRDNITTLYGKTAESRIADPDDPGRVFTWLICESYDDKGNALVYEYAAENDDNVDRSQVNERNRVRTANRYLKRIKYGNRVSRLIELDLTLAEWLFEVVFDYDERHYEELDLDPGKPEAEQHRFVRGSASSGQPWTVRPDPFSAHRAGFEVRTYRRCRRVLMFHRFAELGPEPCLVRSTELEYADLDYTQPTTIEAELAHQGSTRFASFIRAVTQSGFVRDAAQAVLERDGVKYVTYLKKSLPPLEFEYSKAIIQDDIRELDAASLENLPVGLDGATYQWVDLDGEGVSGILTEQADAWFYKPNLGEGRFGSLEKVAVKPSPADLSNGRQQLLDLAGDGQLDLVAFSGPAPGFFERTQNEDWEPFRAFDRLPNISWDEPNLRFIDLDGDGHADVLITEHQAFTWYPSLAEEGFGAALQVGQSLDEEKGPRLVLADGEQSIYLADMCGDGLTDLVRIRNGEVCYWPNHGYGRFGAKVTMDNAPWFDQPDLFDQQRIRLADIDGSGVTDIMYLGGDGIRLYFNQSGNRWSGPRSLNQIPHVDNLSAVTTADLLGNGTACLVWSSPLPGDARRPLRYIDLMGGQKPHLLIRSINNLGAETHVHYAPSTKFYLADKLAGKPWITRLPFPVHVVEHVETFDRISGNRFVTRYAYHHGYFDGLEREFRGFGMVEQWDTEEFSALTGDGRLPAATNVDLASHVPPVLTRTWFHTGVHLGRGHVSNFFAGLLDADDVGEYYREPGLTDEQARELLLEDTQPPDGLTVDEKREACRALRGSMLRQEIYALDGTPEEPHPYTVTEQSFGIRRLQPRAENRHGVFFAHPRESITYHYERNPADPRVAHALTLEVDDFGNLLKSAAIGYKRREVIRVIDELGESIEIPNPDLNELEPRDWDKQRQILITYMQNRVTNAIDSAADHRTPLPCESRIYELTGLDREDDHRFTFDEVLTAVLAATFRDYESESIPGSLQKRLIEHVRTLYRKDDLTAFLPFGEIEPLALPGESHKLALTPGLVRHIFKRRPAGQPEEDLLPDPAPLLEGKAGDQGGYVVMDGAWWIPAGRSFFDPDTNIDNPALTVVRERSMARQHFYLPRKFVDPFGHDTQVDYDDHDLLVASTRDALDNVITAANDYRVLQPRLVTDPNRNRSEVAFDALGLVVGTAVMGKAPPVPVEGDSLDAFEVDLAQAQIEGFFNAADPRVPAPALLGGATTRIVYDLDRFRRTRQEHPEDSGQWAPAAYAATLTRETHVSDPLPPTGLRIQISFSYSDGFGREIQKKIQAEPERIAGVAGPPRWVGSGWMVFNNKGKPVRQYEPFFAETHRFEFDVRVGVSPILFYDPVERVVATLHPNHTYQKVVFDAWRQVTWDVNDMVLEADPKSDADVGNFFRRLPDAEYLPTWHARRIGRPVGDPERAAAERSAAHAGTPTTAHFDTLGRPFLTLADNGPDPTSPGRHLLFATRVELDIESNQRAVVDAKDRIVMRYDYDLLANRIHQASMEAGERWTLNDATGKAIRAWDSRDHQFLNTYDALRRPVEMALHAGGGPRLLVGRTAYGEARTDPEANNLRGQTVEVFDQAGVVTSDEYDFKGNLLRSQRQLAQDYNATLDWSAAVSLETDLYVSRTRYDALNRRIRWTAPDGSIIRPGYNEANLLERVEANLRGAAVVTPFVTNIDYNAKSQRLRIDYGTRDGQGISTIYDYDPETFRLIHLTTRRNASGFDGTDRPGEVQNLHYTYDPVGNITNIRDGAQREVFFRNRRVEPSTDYNYDAHYRLIEATGREHLGQVGGAPIPHSYNDAPRVKLLHPGDGGVMGRYLERYIYDVVGNIEEMRHIGTDPANPGWTRTFAHDEPSQLEGGKRSNRLTSTTVGDATEKYSTDGDGYDPHGNMLRMPQLQEMRWDFRDQLQMTRRQAVDALDVDGVEHNGERTWYVYDSAGQRVRKVTELASGAIKDERIYLGGFEIYRRHGNDPLVRETLHIMDDKQRVALVETRTEGNQPGVPAQLTRYQFGNHLGTASLELDDEAKIISSEEYTPYGSTAYQAIRRERETPKRYRYTGKERDEESGLYYNGARYYVPWLGRWSSCDAKALIDGVNTYQYGHGAPTKYIDPDGYQPQPFQQFTAPIGQFSAADLNAATTAVFGEISANLHPRLATEAHAVASSIFNRVLDVQRTRAEASRLRRELTAAQTAFRTAEEAFRQARDPVPRARDAVTLAQSRVRAATAGVTRTERRLHQLQSSRQRPTPAAVATAQRNLTQARDRLERAQVGLRTATEARDRAVAALDAARETRNEAQADLQTASAAFRRADDARIAAEAYLGGSGAAATLTSAVTAEGQYTGYAGGQALLAERSQWTPEAAARQQRRWEVARTAVEELARDPSRAASFIEFRSSRGGDRPLRRGETRIGGNDFWGR